MPAAVLVPLPGVRGSSFVLGGGSRRCWCRCFLPQGALHHAAAAFSTFLVCFSALVLLPPHCPLSARPGWHPQPPRARARSRHSARHSTLQPAAGF